VPLVTAAITTYNRARYLSAAIEGALAQTVDDLEVVVVDDGSTDGTAASVEPYLDRVRYVRQANQGRAAARNTAVSLAAGAYLAFCDSDDVWYPDRLERQLEALRDRPGVGLVHGHVDVVDAQGRLLPEHTSRHRAVFSAAHRRPPAYAGYALECRCLSSTILVRREVFDTVGPYDTELPIEDYDFYLRLLLAYDVLFLDGAPLARYRVHPGQVDERRLGLGQIRTAERHLAQLAAGREVPDARRARRNFELMIARTWRVLGDRRKARHAALRALRLGAPRALRFMV